MRIRKTAGIIITVFLAVLILAGCSPKEPKEIQYGGVSKREAAYSEKDIYVCKETYKAAEVQISGNPVPVEEGFSFQFSRDGWYPDLSGNRYSEYDAPTTLFDVTISEELTAEMTEDEGSVILPEDTAFEVYVFLVVANEVDAAEYGTEGFIFQYVNTNLKSENLTLEEMVSLTLQTVNGGGANLSVFTLPFTKANPEALAVFKAYFVAYGKEVIDLHLEPIPGAEEEDSEEIGEDARAEGDGAEGNAAENTDNDNVDSTPLNGVDQG